MLRGNHKTCAALFMLIFFTAGCGMFDYLDGTETQNIRATGGF